MHATRVHVFPALHVTLSSAGLEGEPAAVAARAADAVTRTPSSWWSSDPQPVRTVGGETLEVLAVEFAGEVSRVTVEVPGSGADAVASQHHFDCRLQPVDGYPDVATAREAQLQAECNRLAAQIKALGRQLDDAKGWASTLYYQLDDASSVVDPGEDEEYAYQAELEGAAAFLGISRGVTDPRRGVLDALGYHIEAHASIAGQWVWQGPVRGSKASFGSPAEALEDAWERPVRLTRRRKAIRRDAWDRMTLDEQIAAVCEALSAAGG